MIRVGAKTHSGNVRTENQDRMGRFATPFGELYIIADGMGGHSGGSTAASMTIEGFDAHLKSLPPGISYQEALQLAASKTNLDVYTRARSGDPDISKMGATVVLGLLSGSQMLIGHLGDSRAYLFRDGKLKQLTQDHTVVQQMVAHNMISEEQARFHPDANIVTRAIGHKPEIELELTGPVSLNEGDGILLCSDGLSGYVDGSAIERAINKYHDAQSIADGLISLGLLAGGEDNITVQFIQFGSRPDERIKAAKPEADDQY